MVQTMSQTETETENVHGSRVNGTRPVAATAPKRRSLIAWVLAAAVLAAAGGGVLWGAQYTRGYVHDQLAEQQIFFPPKGPALYGDISQYAGQRVDTGPEAKAYANQFIARHIAADTGGKTFSQVSEAARANPDDAKLAEQRRSALDGQLLRGTLLNAYAWWLVGTIALDASLVLFVLALATLVAGLFWSRRTA